MAKKARVLQISINKYGYNTILENLFDSDKESAMTISKLTHTNKYDNAFYWNHFTH
jgi:hypothetical protein